MFTPTRNEKKKSGLALVAGLVGAFVAVGHQQDATAGEHMLVLIDQSGSMTTESVAGGSRWDVARQLASDAVGAVAPDRQYAVWTFAGSAYTQIVSFADGLTQAQVQAVIDTGLTPPGYAATPLAGSVCDAVDELISYLPSEFHLKRIELFSDGLENNTPNAHECHGPDSADHSNPDVGSWEWKVFNKVRTGNPNSASLPPIPLIVNADYLFDNESAVFSSTFAASASKSANFASIAKSVSGRTVVATRIKQPIKPIRSISSPLIKSLEAERVVIPSAIITAPHIAIAQNIEFYQELAFQTGGRYREFTSSSTLPQLGDLTNDNCVDNDDYNAVVNNWGNPVGPGSLLDPNQDGKVDVYDYMTVLQNFGEGSGC